LGQEYTFDYTVFNNNIREIGLIVHEQALNKLYENIDNPELISILIHRGSYWFDSLRSSIIWYCNEIVGGHPEKTIKISLVNSLMGSGLGIHDDIIDNTKFKHSRENVYGKFGLKRALVIGDLYIVKALTSMTLLLDEFEKETVVSLVNIFKDFYIEMADAEILEICSNKEIDIELDDYHKMLWKLGIDFRACTELGAVSGNASTEELESLSYIGSCFGYINRLNEEISDILNINGSLSMRIKNESIPLALIYATKQSDFNYNIIEEIINKKELNEKDLQKIIKICIESGAINYIKEKIEETYSIAQERLEVFPSSYSQKMLVWILYFITNRNEILKNVGRLPFSTWTRSKFRKCEL
jgi:geranylgeranyl pyrophosphate synthase